MKMRGGFKVKSQIIPNADKREHILDESCWCRPYPDGQEPLAIIHRKEGEA